MTAPLRAAGQAILSLTDRLFKTRGGGYPSLEATDEAKADFVARLLMDTEGDAMLRFKRATQAFLFSDGRQHLDWTKKDSIWVDQPTPEGRIFVTMNYIRPVLRSRRQRLLSGDLSWGVRPRSNDYEERDRGTTFVNFIEHRWEKCEMLSKVRQGLWQSFHAGLSAFKTFWNPNIGPLTPATMILPHLGAQLNPPTEGSVAPPQMPDGKPHPFAGQPIPTRYPVDRTGNPLADEQGNPAPDASEGVFRYRPGDTDTALRSVFNLRLNPDAAGFTMDEGCRWLLDSDIVPISFVKERYGDRADKVSSLAGSTAGRNYERIVRSMGQSLGIRSPGADWTGGKAGDLPDKEVTMLTEYWEHPNDSLKEGRLIVVAGDQLLYPRVDLGDKEGLPQGFVPIVPLYDERRPFDWGGRGVVEDIIPPQKVINRQWESELEQQMRDGVGQWIMWGIPGLSNQITNMSGAHIEIPTTTAVANRSIGDVVSKVPPSGFNPSRWRLIEEAKSAIFDIAAYHEIQRGQVPPGVDSGIAVQYLQEAENAQLADPAENLKSTLLQWAVHQGKMAEWGYGEEEERFLPVHRQDLGFLVESVKGKDLPDMDDIDVTLDGFRPTSQASMRAEVKEAMQQGWIDPRQGMLLLDLGRGVEGAFESETLHYARARRENLDIQKGLVELVQHPEGDPLAGLPGLMHPADPMKPGSKPTPFLLPADDNAEIHIPIHQAIALDDTQPWQVRENALIHLSEHRMMMAQQVMATAAAGNDPGAGDQGGGGDQPPKKPPSGGGK